MSKYFNRVSIQKKANVFFGGHSINHVIQFKDGTKKILGVIIPTDQPLKVKTLTAKRIEITSGQCKVQIGNSTKIQTFNSDQSFYVPKNSFFRIFTTEVIDYICHFE